MTQSDSVCHLLHFVSGRMAKKNQNESQMLTQFFHFLLSFPFFFVFTFEFSSVYSQWCSKHPLRDNFTFSSSLLSHTVVRLHKGKIESLRQNRSLLQTQSPASYSHCVWQKVQDRWGASSTGCAFEIYHRLISFADVYQLFWGVGIKLLSC